MNKISAQNINISIINLISEVAEKENLEIYLVGGFVRDLILERGSKDIDILFANEDEICSLAQTNSLVNAIEYCKNLGILIAVTIGEKGSILISSNKVIEIQAIPVENVVDLTGAGDLFAAGFLFGLARNKTLEECGRYGSLASSEIISHFGARPFRNLSELI